MADNTESKELPKKYDPAEREKNWQEFWDEHDIYKFEPDSEAEIFSIDTPPPTVSGEMHMGHAFMYSQMDFIARFQRMRGKNLFYPFGTDDNGLPTERLVEKTKKVRATKMDRKEFIELCLTTIKELKPKYIQDWKDIGLSADFNVLYSTIDPHSRKISQQSFIDLYKSGHEYQKDAPTIWCPRCQTAIAQVELEDKEMPSVFNDIVFKLQNDDGSETDLVIATTRPELLPSCVAIFAHPDDDRYKDMIGKEAKVPLFDMKVKIMADKKADPEKGTGIVMCCTFGDQNDIEWYKEHNLQLIMSITKDGKMEENTGKYAGMPIKDARKEIIEDLKEAGLLLDQKPITHIVNVHDKCDTDVEIYHSKQWFIRYLDIKPMLLEAGEGLKWYPHHMSHRYTNWIEGLAWDWCISRQRFFGVPIPVWYCTKCEQVKLPEESQLPVDPMNDKPLSPCECGSEDFRGEKDILDTWATSSLTPLIAADLFKDHPVREKLLPMNLRPQGHDIITFWLFNTVVKSRMHHEQNPWKDVMITGWALDPRGKKMSKSKGNVIRPQDMREKYSADALRFWAAGSKLGEDLAFQEKDLITGKKTVTKLWNASKFTMMNLEDYDPIKTAELGDDKLHPVDKWMLSKLNKVIKTSTDSFEKYEYSRTRLDVEKFFWKDFCDNYLEMIKYRTYNPDVYGDEAKLSAQYTLYNTILTVLKLNAPLMPYITEEIYQLFFHKYEKKQSIHLTKWPEVVEGLINEEAEEAGDIAVDIIGAVRKMKSENQVSLKTPVTKMIIECHDDMKAKIETVLIDIKETTKTEELVFDTVPESHIASENYDLKIAVTLGELPPKE